MGECGEGGGEEKEAEGGGDGGEDAPGGVGAEVVEQLLREEGEDGAEERVCGEQGGGCVVAAVVGLEFEDVAGEDGGVFVYAVADEDERDCGSGPWEGVGVCAGNRPCEPPQSQC